MLNCLLALFLSRPCRTSPASWAHSLKTHTMQVCTNIPGSSSGTLAPVAQTVGTTTFSLKRTNTATVIVVWLNQQVIQTLVPMLACAWKHNYKKRNSSLLGCDLHISLWQRDSSTVQTAQEHISLTGAPITAADMFIFHLFTANTRGTMLTHVITSN